MTDASSCDLSLRLLGRFELRAGEQLLLDDAWPRRKGLALLKLLALEPSHGLHREVVLDRLWPRFSATAAANNLRQTLHHVRAGLAAADQPRPCVVVNGDIISLAPSVVVDVDRFVEAADAASAARTDARLYADALALWGGELLPADAYDEWTRPHRERLRTVWMTALLEYGQLREIRGDAPGAVASAEELLRYDPFNEEALCCLMRGLAQAGQRHRAVARYGEWVERVATELGIEPSPPTRALCEQIAASRFVADHGHRDGRPFVGREPELNAIRRAVDATLNGRGGVVLVTGEPGIGKTETAREASTYARLRGARVLWGRCYEGEGAPPYWPWLQILRMFGEQAGRDELADAIGRGAAELARILPELRDHLPASANAPSQENNEARFRLFESVSLFLKHAARRQPLLVIVDDLQGADEASLLLLDFVARELARVPVLIVATCRHNGNRNAALSRAVSDLVRIPAVVSMTLTGLSQAEIRSYIEIITGRSATDEAAGTVHLQTAGNAFFVSQVVRLMEGEGEADSTGVPPNVKDVVAQRIELLSPASRRVLTIGAALGTEFSLNVLQRATDLDSADLLAKLEEAAAAHIVQEQTGGIRSYRFIHALLRDSLYEVLSGQARGEIHGRITDAYETAYGSIPEELVAEVAHHSFLALTGGGGGVERAVAYQIRAAEVAARMLAHEEAAGCYSRALEAYAMHQPIDEATRCDLLLRLAWAQVAAGRRNDAAVTARDALALARRAGTPALLARAAMILLPRVAWDEPPVDNAEVISLLEEVHDALGSERSPRHADVLSRLGVELRHDPALAERRTDVSRAAVDMARASSDRTILAQVLVGDLYINAESLTVEQRLARASEACEIAESVCARSQELQARGWRIDSYLRLGDMPRADAEIDAYRASAEAIGEAAYLWIAGLMQTMRVAMAGRLSEAAGLVMDSVGTAARAQIANGMVALGGQMTVIRIDQGRYAEMAATIEQFSRGSILLPSARAALAALYCYDGQLKEARKHYEYLAADGFRSLPHHLYNGHTDLARVADVCAELDDQPRALQLYGLLAPYAAYNITAMVGLICAGSVSRSLGILAGVLRRWPDAERHFRDALAMNDEIGAVTFAARTRVDHAAMLMRRGRAADRPRAEALIDAAIPIAQSTDMQGLLKRIERLTPS